jgi:uncharacterized protein (DUF58 family)
MQPSTSRVADWIFPHHGTEHGPVVLTQRRVYILPTGQGLLFAITIALLLIGSINYNLSLGYVLTFLLAGLGVVAMLHTWRNLARIALRPGRVSPVYAGEHAVFAITLENHAAFDRIAIGATADATPGTYADIDALGAASIRITVPTTRRGWRPLGRFRVYTTFPLGLFRAWSNVELDERCLVYPRPEAGDPPLPRAVAVSGDTGGHGRGAEDFAGLREYHPGDSPRHVAWKAYARGEQLLTKQFGGRAGSEVWLDWNEIAGIFGVEQRLARLTRWALMADADGTAYGLRIPGLEIPPAVGTGHRAACLQALALYEPTGGR